MASDPGVLQALPLIPLSLLGGLTVFTAYINRYVKSWGWLETWGQRLSFMLWPEPPGNIVKLVYPSGEVELHYNVEVREGPGSLLLILPHGVVRVKPARTMVVAMNVYVPGKPSPLHFVTGAMAGLITVYLILYYGMLAAGFGPYSLLAIAVLGWAYAWWRVAMTPSTTMISAIVTSMASGLLHAVPTPGEVISPREFLRLMGRGVTIVVDRSAAEALEELAREMGGEEPDRVSAAEALSIAGGYIALRRRLAFLMDKAREVRNAEMTIMQRTMVEIQRVTLAKALAYAIFFLIGVLIGWAVFGGGDVVILPAGGMGVVQP